MINALSTTVSQTLGERTVEALTNLVLGMLVVFAVLTILYVVLTLVGKIFIAEEKKKAKSNVVNAETPTAPQAQDESQGNTDNSGNAEEIVAAITAAITVYLEDEGVAPGSFRVVSFRKSNTKPSWNKK